MTKLLTRKEAADRLGVTVDTLDAERSAGRMVYIQSKPCGRVWISEEAIEEYLARATHLARPERMVLQTYRKRRK